MNTLRNKLLNVLPQEERSHQAAPRTVKAKAYEGGLEGLKNLIADRCHELSSFKYAAGADHLYAYFKTKNAADQLLADATGGVIYGKVAVKRSGTFSVRFDSASKFAGGPRISPQENQLGDWATYVVDRKQMFRDIFGTLAGVSVTYTLAASTNTLYAYATSARHNETPFVLGARMLASRDPDVVITNKGAYGVSAKFIFDPEKPLVTPQLDVVTSQPPVNKLVKSLAAINRVSIEAIRDQVSPDVYEQFQRILDGERLPAAPLITRYRDANNLPFTAMYAKNNQRVDLEAIVASIRLQGRQMHTMSSDIAYVIVEDQRVEKPALIVMTDVVDPDAVHVTVVAPGVNKQVKLFKQK